MPWLWAYCRRSDGYVPTVPWFLPIVPGGPRFHCRYLVFLVRSGCSTAQPSARKAGAARRRLAAIPCAFVGQSFGNGLVVSLQSSSLAVPFHGTVIIARMASATGSASATCSAI